MINPMKEQEKKQEKNEKSRQESFTQETLHFVTDFFTEFRWETHKKAVMIITLGALYVVLFWVGMYLIDFRNIFGISSDQGFWWHAFRNRGPVEIGQWALMSLVVVTSGRISGIFEERGDREGKILWLLIAATFAMMVIEDAGDPRHIQGRYFVQFFGINRNLVEAGFFGVMTFPIIFGFLRYWKKAFQVVESRLYLILGGLFYATAAGTSLFRWVGRFYARVGDRISELFFGGSIPGFFLMDFVFEESLELMAGAVFLAGAYLYLENLKKNQELQK